MQGVTIFIDEKTKKRYAQLDLAALSGKESEQIEELIDILIAESRKYEKDVSLSEMKRFLKRKGKL